MEEDLCSGPPEPTSETELRKRAHDLALLRLSVREYSARELTAYLKRKEIPAPLAAAIVEELVESRALDDRRYARAVTRSQALRDKGPRYILQKLRQKGVRIELPEVSALYSETSDHGELEQALKLVERRYPKAAQDGKEFRRAYAALLRRGFSGEVVRKALAGRAPDQDSE